jgi:carboxyl-terminal processing protease
MTANAFELSMKSMARILISALVVTCLLPAAIGASPSRPVAVEDLRAFADAWGYIKDHYVEEIDDRALLEAALRGMLSELDPHSAWLSADDLSSVEEQASGRYGGLGIRIAVQNDHLQIVAAMGNSPAERAGLQPGDRIIAIDDTSLDESNTGQATEWLRGAPGTLVALTIEREGKSQHLHLALTREMIHRISVTAESLDDGFELIKINNFQQNTAEELDAILTELDLQSVPPAGLILDLRDNPGGILQEAVAVADRFLTDKLVVYADGRGKSQTLSLGTGSGEFLPEIPMVVLVNRNSASAAEILAGALQDHGRALVLGESTYGKGSIQTIWPLRNGDGMRLTTALYFTPSGRQIQSQGIVPDVHGGSLLASSDSGALNESGNDTLVDEALILFRSAQRLYQVSRSP